MADSTEAIIYSEAVRMIAEQRADRESVRGRGGTLLSAAALVTSFLGGFALSTYHDAHPHAGLTVLAWTAIGAFIFVVAAAVVLLLPLRWIVVSPTVLIEDHLAEDAKTAPDDLRRFLAEAYEGHSRTNQRQIQWLYVAFVLASLALMYEALAWSLMLGGVTA